MKICPWRVLQKQNYPPGKTVQRKVLTIVFTKGILTLKSHLFCYARFEMYDFSDTLAGTATKKETNDFVYKMSFENQEWSVKITQRNLQAIRRRATSNLYHSRKSHTYDDGGQSKSWLFTPVTFFSL